MQPTDRGDFKDLMTAAMAFYRRDMSPFALGVWWEACKAFELEQVSKALTAHATDPEQGRFPPMPADVVKHLAGTKTDRSLVAWSKAMQAMARVGSWGSVAFDDPAIHATIEDMGGWPLLCATTDDELPFVQKRFCDTYRAYASRPDVPHLAVLRGNHDANPENIKKGLLQKPALIGDRGRAAMVAAGPNRDRAQITHVSSALLDMRRQGDAA
jgi:hypothetical protein